MTTTRLDHIAARQHATRVRDYLFAFIAALVLVVQLAGFGAAGGIPLAAAEPAATPPTPIEVIEARDRARHYADTAPCDVDRAAITARRAGPAAAFPPAC